MNIRISFIIPVFNVENISKDVFYQLKIKIYQEMNMN